MSATPTEHPDRLRHLIAQVPHDYSCEGEEHDALREVVERLRPTGTTPRIVMPRPRGFGR